MMMAIKDMRKNKEQYFTLKPIPVDEEAKESVVWVVDEYDRSEKAYWCYKFSDVNHGRFFKGNKQVFVGFTF